MKYEIFLAPRAKRQYERFDRHIQDEIESQEKASPMLLEMTLPVVTFSFNHQSSISRLESL